jgi:hypothetical protein
MNHTKKIKLARRLRTTEDIKEHRPIFNTLNWNIRKEAIRQRVKKNEDKQHKNKIG